MGNKDKYFIYFVVEFWIRSSIIFGVSLIMKVEGDNFGEDEIFWEDNLDCLSYWFLLYGNCFFNVKLLCFVRKIW